MCGIQSCHDGIDSKTVDPCFCGDVLLPFGLLSGREKLLKKKLDYLEHLCGEVKHLYAKGWSVPEIRDQLFSNKHPIIAISEGKGIPCASFLQLLKN